jgi:hypothetical protein
MDGGSVDLTALQVERPAESLDTVDEPSQTGALA